MDQEEWGEPDGLAASDSCLTGCGSFSEGKFFHTVLPDLKQNLHINFLELLAIMVTVTLWGQYWRGKKIVLYTDKILAGLLIPVYRAILLCSLALEKFVFMQR